MPRVIIWADEWYPVVGGLELALHRTACSLAKNDVNVIVLTPDDGLDRSGLPYTVVAHSRTTWFMASSLWLKKTCRDTDILYVARLFRKLERAQLRVMESLKAFRILRVPSTWSATRYDSMGYRRALLKSFDRFVALNISTLKELRHRFSPELSELHYNWTEHKNSYFNVERIGYVFSGRFVSSKNSDNLIEAAYNFYKTNGIPLTIIVDRNKHEEEIKNTLKNYGNDFFDFREPYVPGSMETLRSFRFLCLPTYREGCPNILVEAFSLGTPVIGTDVPGVSEHVSAVGGTLINRPFDANAIFDALCKGFSLPQNSYQDIQSKCVSYAKDVFSKETVSDMILEKYLAFKKFN